MVGGYGPTWRESHGGNHVRQLLTLHLQSEAEQMLGLSSTFSFLIQNSTHAMGPLTVEVSLSISERPNLDDPFQALLEAYLLDDSRSSQVNSINHHIPGFYMLVHTHVPI